MRARFASTLSLEERSSLTWARTRRPPVADKSLFAAGSVRQFEPRDGRLSLKVALWPLGQCTGDLNDSTRWRSRRARCMPTRLSRYVRFPVRRQERQAGRCDRRSRSSDDARRTLRQAQRLCRASLQPRPAALPDAAHRRQRQRSVRAHLVGRCSRGNQEPLDGHHRDLRRASDHAPRLSRPPGHAQRAHGRATRSSIAWDRPWRKKPIASPDRRRPGS